MTEQSTDAIRLAAMDQYIIDQEAKYKRELSNLRANRAVWVGLTVVAFIGMFSQFQIARECINLHPNAVIYLDK